MSLSRYAPPSAIDQPAGPPPLGNRALPYAFTIGALLLIVPLGVKGTTEAALGAGFVVGLILLFLFGLETLGSAIVVVAMFFAPMTAMVLPGLSFVTISDFAVVVGFMLLFPSVIRKPVWVPWQFSLGSLVFFIVACVSSFLPPSPLSALDLTLRVTAATILLPLAFVWWAPRGKRLFWLVAAYPIGQTFNVIYSLGEGPISAGNGRYRGLTEQPTAFGYASLLGMCVLPFIAATLPQGRRWVVIPSGFILGYGIWISGSRASLLVLLILVVMYPLLEKSIKAAGFVALLGIIAMAMFQRILEQNNGSNALARLLGGGGAGGSDEARLEGLAAAFKVFQKSPIIGNGFEFDTFLAHNIYMQVLTCVGVIGFVGFMLVLWAYAIPLFTAKAPYRLLAYPAVAYIVVGPITPNLGSRYVGIMLGVSFVAATIGRMGPDDVVLDEDEETEAPPPKHAAGVARPA